MEKLQELKLMCLFLVEGKIQVAQKLFFESSFAVDIQNSLNDAVCLCSKLRVLS